MIETKQDLIQYLNSDMAFYYRQDKKTRFMYWLTQDPVFFIAKYLRYLRKEEYYTNARKDPLGKGLCLYNFRRKNRLGNKLGFKIPRNCFGPGLTIYHHGEIIVNEDARIGCGCVLHGGNCIGNNGITNDAPQIGDDLDLGIGAKIIGGVVLDNDITVGANAIVTKTFSGDGLVLAGIPAALIKTKEKQEF